MHTKKRSSWMDDGDDAHFDGNPAYRKHNARKHLAASGRTLQYVGKGKAQKKTAGKKRVAGK